MAILKAWLRGEVITISLTAFKNCFLEKDTSEADGIETNEHNGGGRSLVWIIKCTIC